MQPQNFTHFPWIDWLQALIKNDDGKFLLALVIIICLTMLDIITGYTKSLILKVPDSDTGSRGLIKHLSGIILICFMFVFAVMLGDIGLTFMWFVNVFYMWTQFTSIIENLDAIGVPVSVFKYFIKTVESKDPDLKKYNDSNK